MWFLRVSRQGFIDILSRNRQRSFRYERINTLPQHQPAPDEIFAIWQVNPDNTTILPSLVIIPSGQTTNFIAWTSTYFPNFRPITAYVRVVDWDLAYKFRGINNKRYINRFEDICVGVIIAEILSLSQQKLSSESITPLFCASTYSYCFTKAMALGLTEESIEEIFSRLLRARKLTLQQNRTIDVESLKIIWKIILKLYNEDLKNISSEEKHNNLPCNSLDLFTSQIASTSSAEQIFRACHELKLYGDIKEETWSDISKNLLDFNAVKEQLAGTRENRVLYCEKIINGSELNDATSAHLRDFICAYLVSRINPGSMSHANLILSYQNKFPSAMLWYGMLAGLSPKSDLLSEYNGLGRRVLRDLLESGSLTDRPYADIAVDELEVFFNGDNPIKEFRKASHNYLEIEIVPCISTVVRWSSIDKGQQIDSNESNNEPKHANLIKKLSETLKQADEILKEFSTEKVADSKQKTQKIQAKERIRKEKKGGGKNQ